MCVGEGVGGGKGGREGREGVSWGGESSKCAGPSSTLLPCFTSFRDPSVHRHMLHDEDAESYSCWASELKGGAPAEHAMLPVVHGGPGVMAQLGEF